MKPTAITRFNQDLTLSGTGTVNVWGDNGSSLGWNLLEMPDDATNVMAIAAGALHSVVLRSNGTVVAWGYNAGGQTNVPAGLSNVVAIAAGGEHNLALKEDGTIVGWGANTYGQATPPSGLSNVIETCVRLFRLCPTIRTALAGTANLATLRRMSWKVLITARTLHEVGKSALELLRGAGCELVFPPRFGPLSAEDLLKNLDGMDAVLASMDHFTPTVLGSPLAAHLKIISRWGVGYDAIDVPRATRLGIVVAYTPGLLNETVADYAFALLFAVARRVHEGYLSMHDGEWQSAWGHDIAGKTLGIIGCGRIGQAVARRAGGFNMKLLGHDIAPHPEAEKLGVEFVSLDRLLAESDFVSLHAALTPQNRGMLGETQFRQMKPSSYLINTARGALIDEQALVRALQEGWIAGAALDAFSVEPLPPEHPFRSTRHLLITPHQASFARETGERVSRAAAQAIVELMQGRKPQFVVDPGVFDSPQLRAKLK